MNEVEAYKKFANFNYQEKTVLSIVFEKFDLRFPDTTIRDEGGCPEFYEKLKETVSFL